MADKQTVAVDLAEVRGLAGYIADLEDDGDTASAHEAVGAWEVVLRLGLIDIVVDAAGDLRADEDED